MIKIASLSYYNCLPFNVGVNEEKNRDNFKMTLYTPEQCTETILSGVNDVAIIPSINIPKIEEVATITTNFCIASIGEVKSVMLFANVEIERITKIYLDNQSTTSVELLKILLEKYWMVNPVLEVINVEYLEVVSSLKDTEGVLLIGDKAMSISKQFEFKWESDLSLNWNKMTGLPFVFAVWVARKDMKIKDLHYLNRVFKDGFENLDSSIDKDFEDRDAIKDYLKKNISYEFNAKAMEGLNLFLALSREKNAM